MHPLYSKETRTGHTVRDCRGRIIVKIRDVPLDKEAHHMICDATQELNGFQERFIRIIKDKKISGRIADYFAKFYGKKRTNCASFANYLITGEFTECVTPDRNLVLTQRMTTYNGQKIVVGDMLCLLYYHPINRTRLSKNKGRNRYVRHKKLTHQGKGFLETCKAKKVVSLPPEEIKDMFYRGAYTDFHFLVCVGLNAEGKPVFAQQHGHYWPEQEEPARISVSIGDANPYPYEIPAFVFINRAKNR